MSTSTHRPPEDASAAPGDGPDSSRSPVALLDVVEALPAAALLRARSYDLLQLLPAATVVDVGCGSGRAVSELQERGGRAIGVDTDPTMLAVAARRWPDADFRQAEAYHLPLNTGEAAGYRADKLFHLLDDPDRALTEARRALAPGGRIVLVGQDWDGILVDSDDVPLTRAIVHARADSMANPRPARAYRAMLRDHGFVDVTVEVHTGLFTDGSMLPVLDGLADAACRVGAVPRSAADSWLEEQAQRARDARLVIAVPVFVAAATR